MPCLRSWTLAIACVCAAAALQAQARQPIKGEMTKPENRAGLGCGVDNAAAVPALQRRARPAGFYDHGVALRGAQVLEWRLDGPARTITIDAADRLWRWRLGATSAAPVAELDAVALASAGESGVLAIRCDGGLWQRGDGSGAAWQRIAPRAIHAWVGDSSDHYIDGDGRLFVAGKAHRGQYGTGQLTDATGWVPSTESARFVVAHTGHAVHLRDDGAVLGTAATDSAPPSHAGSG
jgi:hypothetical protein